MYLFKMNWISILEPQCRSHPHPYCVVECREQTSSNLSPSLWPSFRPPPSGRPFMPPPAGRPLQATPFRPPSSHRPLQAAPCRLPPAGRPLQAAAHLQVFVVLAVLLAAGHLALHGDPLVQLGGLAQVHVVALRLAQQLPPVHTQLLQLRQLLLQLSLQQQRQRCVKLVSYRPQTHVSNSAVVGVCTDAVMQLSSYPTYLYTLCSHTMFMFYFFLFLIQYYIFLQSFNCFQYQTMFTSALLS